MSVIHFPTPQSLRKDNKKLCQFLDTVFDTSIIVDKNCKIINFGKGYHQLRSDQISRYLDRSISEIDTDTPFYEVIHTGRSIVNRLVMIDQVKALQSIFPIMIQDKIAGALAVSTYFNLEFLKDQLMQQNRNYADSLNLMIGQSERQFPDINPLCLTDQELENGDETLEPLLNAIFDSAIYIDLHHHVARCNMGKLKLTEAQSAEMRGADISLFDRESPFSRVLCNQKGITNYLSIVFGRLCLNCLYPIFNTDTGKISGVLGTIQYSNIDHLRRLFQAESASMPPINPITARLEKNYTFEDFVGNSQSVENLISICQKVAVTDYPVLITGESGTGKEIIAGAIHTASSAPEFKPYVKINCSAIPHDLLESELFGYKKGAFTGATKDKAGYFEIASSGTLLLDEIGDMDLSLQSKLLRVLESQVFSRVGDTREIPLNARILASTNQDLYQMSKNKTFRLDLYYRLNTFEIKIPPLRERKNDIPILISHFLLKNGGNLGIRPDAIDVMMKYNWPGNVRELRNLINRLCILYAGQSIRAEHVFPYLHWDAESADTPALESPGSSAIIMEPCTLKDGEIALIKAALAAEHNHISNAAKILGITRATLYNKIKKYHLEK